MNIFVYRNEKWGGRDNITIVLKPNQTEKQRELIALKFISKRSGEINLRDINSISGKNINQKGVSFFNEKNRNFASLMRGSVIICNQLHI